MLESEFQKELKKEIKERLPGSYVIKTDPTYIQGMPDLLVLYNKRWASLECKNSNKAKRQPNQEYRVNELNKMSFASFIYPENKEEVLDAMEQSLKRRT